VRCVFPCRICFLCMGRGWERGVGLLLLERGGSSGSLSFRAIVDSVLGREAFGRRCVASIPTLGYLVGNIYHIYTPPNLGLWKKKSPTYAKAPTYDRGNRPYIITAYALSTTWTCDLIFQSRRMGNKPALCHSVKQVALVSVVSGTGCGMRASVDPIYLQYHRVCNCW